MTAKSGGFVVPASPSNNPSGNKYKSLIIITIISFYSLFQSNLPPTMKLTLKVFSFQIFCSLLLNKSMSLSTPFPVSLMLFPIHLLKAGQNVPSIKPTTNVPGTALVVLNLVFTITYKKCYLQN